VLDFIRGASLSSGGKSILMLPSTAQQGKKSRIVPFLGDTAVVVPRSDVQHVVTEYGAVNLFGKSLQERAMGLISIAHPQFREELFFQAKKMGLLSTERTLHESIHGVYPMHLEEVLEINDQQVTVRPAKPVDARRIQEHFYSLDKEDVVARFFHEKRSFDKDEAEEVSQVDYVKDLTILAVVGSSGSVRWRALVSTYWTPPPITLRSPFPSASLTRKWDSARFCSTNWSPPHARTESPVSSPIPRPRIRA